LSESRGCPGFKASKGEAVVCYREPLATRKMGWHRLSQRANKIEIFFLKLYLIDRRYMKIATNEYKLIIFNI